LENVFHYSVIVVVPPALASVMVLYCAYVAQRG